MLGVIEVVGSIPSHRLSFSLMHIYSVIMCRGCWFYSLRGSCTLCFIMFSVIMCRGCWFYSLRGSCTLCFIMFSVIMCCRGCWFYSLRGSCTLCFIMFSVFMCHRGSWFYSLRGSCTLCFIMFSVIMCRGCWFYPLSPLELVAEAHSEAVGSGLHAAADHESVARLKDVQGAGHRGERHGAHEDRDAFIQTENEKKTETEL
ncbi:hypothetical protein NL108_017786 [Boleophthalmus pectinirostris]|nr:hypothetical protein NL108_017786 [Boleophthalmus pectinirostris]